MSKKVYIFSLDSSIRKFLCQKEFFNVFFFSEYEELCSIIKNECPSIILLDYYIAMKIGPDCIQKICVIANKASVFIITEKQNIEFTTYFKTFGIKDLIIIPKEKDILVNRLNIFLENLISSNIEDNYFDFPQTAELDNLLGLTNIMQKIKANIYNIGRTDTPLLLLGESGTGKTHIAKLIHKVSIRNKKPFYALNMANIPEQLAEAELFGTVEGAFTGATDRKGYFSAADSGTLFMDEIGELSSNIQSKLLQVLEEGTFNKVGTEKQQNCNVRLIFATNQNLQNMVNNKSFREDLYYRISVFPIIIPPLRDRKEDIPLLAEHFLKPHKKNLTESSLQKLLDYHWPGNIRELKNCLIRASLISRNDTIQDYHISF